MFFVTSIVYISNISNASAALSCQLPIIFSIAASTLCPLVLGNKTIKKEYLKHWMLLNNLNEFKIFEGRYIV